MTAATGGMVTVVVGSAVVGVVADVGASPVLLVQAASTRARMASRLMPGSA